MLDGRRLRHRILIESCTETQNATTGALTKSWSTFATVWAAIEPSSVKEFTAAQAEQSKISVRIVIRYLAGVKAKMRIYHTAKDKYYNIEGVLSDKVSGVDYLTLPCSELENA